MNNDQSNTPTQQGITPDIKPMLDEAYNTAIDQAISMVNNRMQYFRSIDESPVEDELESIIEKLQQLKKP